MRLSETQVGEEMILVVGVVDIVNLGLYLDGFRFVLSKRNFSGIFVHDKK